MNTGAYTNNTTLTAQADTPSLTAVYHPDTILYEDSDTDFLRWGFVDGAAVSISGDQHHTAGAESTTIASLSVDGDNTSAFFNLGVVTFTTEVSGVDAGRSCNMTKTYTGPHKTQTEANRKRVLGFR